MIKPYLRTNLLTIFALLVIIVISGLVVEEIKRHHVEIIVEEMKLDASQTLNAMKHRINGNINALRFTERFFQASDNINRREFHKFTQGVRGFYPEVQAMQWLPLIRHEQRLGYEGSVQKEGLSGYYISEVSSDEKMIRALSRSIYMPVHFLEPMIGNEKYLGLDAYSNPQAREAMQRAMKTGEVAVTSPTKLEQQKGAQPALLIFLPNLKSTSKVEDKREVLGFVLMIIRMGDFLFSINEKFSLGQTTEYRLSDLTSNGDVIASSNEQFTTSSGWHTIKHKWKIADREWLFEVNFDVRRNLSYRNARIWSWIFFVGIIIISILSFFLVNSKLKFKEEKKITTFAFKNEEEKYQKLLNSSADAYFLQDMSGNLLDVNDVASELMGYSREELLSMNVMDINVLIEGTTQDDYLQYFHKFPKGRSVSRELLYIKKDGSKFPVEISMNKFNYNNEDVLSGFIRDISERKEYENSLKKATDDAEKANLAKSEFLAKMSHEFRTPMHSILSFSDMGLKRLRKIPLDKLESYLSNIQNSGKRLMRLLNNLLDLAKLETGDLKFSYEKKSLFLLLDDCLKEQKHQIDDKHIDISITQQGFSSNVICDADKIRQVISNLVSNAVKFTGNDSNIIIIIDDDNKILGVPGLKFTICDEGEGILKDELEDIFNKFVQSSKVSGSHQGTGLGLAICKEIIEGHGGKIWAENINSGSCLQFVIPLSPLESYTD